MSKAQKLVSGDKYRYRADGYDLDLTYILPRVIAMAIPGEGIEKNWRNNINEVSRFLNGKHGPDYRIFNLTGEEYDYAKFNNQVSDHFDFPDHHPPPLKKLIAVIKAIDDWMVSNTAHVAVVHCLAGRSRTGCVVASYIMYSSLKGSNCSPPLLTTAKDAINFFNFARSEEGQNVVLPSQVRWVYYLEKILKENLSEIVSNPPRYLLKSVRMQPPPFVEDSKKKAVVTPITCVKFLAESAKDSRPPITEAVHPQLWRDDPITDLKIGAEVAGDVEIIWYHNAKSTAAFTTTMTNLYSRVQAIQLASHHPRVPLFRYIFNTAFLTGETVVLNTDDLDAPLAGAVETNEYVRSDMSLILTFEKISNQSIDEIPVMHGSSSVHLVPTSLMRSQKGSPSATSTPATAPIAAPVTNFSATSTSDPIQAAIDAVSRTTHSMSVQDLVGLVSPRSEQPTPPTTSTTSTTSVTSSVNGARSWNSVFPSSGPSAHPLGGHRVSEPTPVSPIVHPTPPNIAIPPTVISPASPTPVASPQVHHAGNPSPHPQHRNFDHPGVPGLSVLADVTGGRKSPTPSPNRSPRVSLGSQDHIPLGVPIVNPSTNPFASAHGPSPNVEHKPTPAPTSEPLLVPTVSTRRISDPRHVPNIAARPSDPKPPQPSPSPQPSPRAPSNVSAPSSPTSAPLHPTQVGLQPPHATPVGLQPPPPSANPVGLQPRPVTPYPGLPNIDPTRQQPQSQPQQPPAPTNAYANYYNQYPQNPAYPNAPANYYPYPNAAHPGHYPTAAPTQYPAQQPYYDPSQYPQGSYPQQQQPYPQSQYPQGQYPQQQQYPQGQYPYYSPAQM